MSEENTTRVSCPECQAGSMRLQQITYFTWLNDELVTVPNFPAWVCDLCKWREYDERAISWLTMLLNPNAGKSRSPKRAHHVRSGEPKGPPRPVSKS